MVGTRDSDNRSFEVFQSQKNGGNSVPPRKKPRRKDGALRLAASALASRKQPGEPDTQLGDAEGTYNVGDNGRS